MIRRRPTVGTDASASVPPEVQAYRALAAAVVEDAIWALAASPRRAIEAGAFLLAEAHPERQTWGSGSS